MSLAVGAGMRPLCHGSLDCLLHHGPLNYLLCHGAQIRYWLGCFPSCKSLSCGASTGTNPPTLQFYVA
ncbi:hypothetical protein QQF64_007870 [Cirrhinus molitorella]|uniref:Uncharacterized protein n=1 Tax=Cirrhinus molitorella TaxID=172907 RepID=A0ABR3M8J1_9TELE